MKLFAQESEMFKLCYVKDQWAYFTTQELDKQWGDDWNDAPYEHNAGTPYKPVWHREAKHVKDGKLCMCESCLADWDGIVPRWEIKCVAFEGPFTQPYEGHFNSPWTVEQINRGAVAWLRSDNYTQHTKVNVMAGCTYDEFIKAVKLGGGKVYAEV